MRKRSPGETKLLETDEHEGVDTDGCGDPSQRFRRNST